MRSSHGGEQSWHGRFALGSCSVIWTLEKVDSFEGTLFRELICRRTQSPHEKSLLPARWVPFLNSKDNTITPLDKTMCKLLLYFLFCDSLLPLGLGMIYLTGGMGKENHRSYYAQAFMGSFLQSFLPIGLFFFFFF